MIMEENRLSLFLGKPIRVNDEIKIYSPKINDIEKIGENIYNLYLCFATFNRNTIFEFLKKIDVINESTDVDLDKFDDYDVLIAMDFIADQIAKALSFFVKDEVLFLDDKFYISNIVFVNKDNYKEISELIKFANYIKEKKKKKLKFKNKRAEEIYKRIEEKREKYNKNDYLGLSDILSVLCNADGNGITIFNVGELTIYQIHEQYNRFSLKEQTNRMLKPWGSGILKEGVKLPEWIVKT